MKIAVVTFALILACPLVAHAQQTATPDAEHQNLAELAGAWNVQQSLWLDGTTSPTVDSGHADFKVVLHRQLQQSLHIDDGTDFEGLGYIGYDNASGQVFSTWMDVNFPGMVVAYGDFDAATGTYSLRGSMSSSTPGATVPVREVMTIQDPNHFRYEYYETHDGKEALTVRLDYARAG